MINKQNSQLLLKKVIQQNSFPSNPIASKIQSFHSLQILSKKSSSINFYQQKKQHIASPQIQVQQQCTFNNNLQPNQLFQFQSLKIQSRLDKQIDCLNIQSKVQQNIEYRPQQIVDLPLQCLQSKIKSHKIKVHSSIDGMQSSKQSNQNNPVNQSKSLPISDLIALDDRYMKRSNGLNQHNNFSLKEEQQQLTAVYYQNLKILKQQTLQKIQCIEKEIQFIQRDQLINKINQKITQIQQKIFKIKLNQYVEIQTKKQFISHKSRSKTPEIHRIRSPKNQSSKQSLFTCQYNQQILQKRINNQRQKMRRQKQKSIKITQKLSRAKYQFKQLQIKLNAYQNEIHGISPPVSPKINISKINHQKSPNSKPVFLSPKSPQRINNCKSKYYQFLQKQKQKYYHTLKTHIMLIYKQIQTFKDYENTKSQQLKRQIELLKNQIRYVDAKGVQKFFFTSPGKGLVKRDTNNKLSRDKSTKRSIFQKNYSQKLICTYSTNSGVPPLSPKSPHINCRSPQLYSRSPQLYQKSSQYSTTSITPRSIKIKDMNKLSDKSTNNSQTKIKRNRNDEQNIYNEIQRKLNKGKQNNYGNKKCHNGIKRKQVKNIKTIYDNNNNLHSNRKALTNIRGEKNQVDIIRTQISDDYCINNQNEFKF